MRFRIPWLAVSLITACGGVDDFHDDEPCKQAGYAIASRTLDCTSDADLSDARYEALIASTRCVAGNLNTTEFKCNGDPHCGVNNFTCAVELNKVDCATVKAYGSDMRMWITHNGACTDILKQPDGATFTRVRRLP
jgi:hypothetical protein